MPAVENTRCSFSTGGSSLGMPLLVTAISSRRIGRALGMCSLQNSGVEPMQSTTRSGSCRCSASHEVVTSISGRSFGVAAFCAPVRKPVITTSSVAAMIRRNIFHSLPQCFAFHYRQLVHMAPLMNRAIKHGGIISQIFCDKVHVRGLKTNLTIGNQLLSRHNASCRKQLLQFVRRKKHWLVFGINQRFLPVDRQRARNVPIDIALFWTRIH